MKKRYYLEDEYNNNHQAACTCAQKYGKCMCEKPLKQKPSKRKHSEKRVSAQKPEAIYLTPHRPDEGGCGGCGTGETNGKKSGYDQRTTHSTPPPVLQPIAASPVAPKQKTSAFTCVPSKGKDLPYYKEDVPTRERAYMVEQQHQPIKIYLKESNYATDQTQNPKQTHHVTSFGEQHQICRQRQETPTQTKNPNMEPQKETLNVQFPCPCMSVNMNGFKKADLWDLQFYKWWGWNWLKEREDILRKQMEKEGKRFSEEFPILMANYYATEKQQQKQNKQDSLAQQEQSHQLQQHRKEENHPRQSQQSQQAPQQKEKILPLQKQQVRYSQQSYQSHLHHKEDDRPQHQQDRNSQQHYLSQQLHNEERRAQHRQDRQSQQSRQSQLLRKDEHRLQYQQDRHSQQSHQSQLQGKEDYLPLLNQQQKDRHSQQSQQQNKLELHPQQQQLRPSIRSGHSQHYYNGGHPPLHHYQQDRQSQDSQQLQSQEYYQLVHQEPQYTQQYRDLFQQPQHYGPPRNEAIEVHGDCCTGAIEEVQSASRHPEVKQAKTWSIMKTIHNVFKTMTCKDRKPSDETGICQCGARLNICGPYNKPCHGIEGVIMPCGFECECGPDKKCLLPYLNELCPCGQTCRCPKEYRAAPLSQYQMGLAPSQQPIVGPAMVENDYKEDLCGCEEEPEQVQVISTQSIVKLKPSEEDCCCSCDEEMCPCCCCCCLDISQKRIQTSRFCLRENCTQTEKTTRKCCRCCKCCSSKGKKLCSMCMKSSDGNINNNNNNGGDNAPRGHSFSSKNARDALSRSYLSTQDRIYLRPHTTPTGAWQNEDHQSGYHPHHYYQNDRRLNNSILTNSVKTRGKTMIVKSNSIQCIPSQENKSTSCTYDDTITSETRFNNFLSQLHASANVEVNSGLFSDSGGVDVTQNLRKTPITLDAGDINRLTKAKLRNCFLEGDVYSSPVSGRNYDLSYRTIDAPSKPADTKLLKPLDVNDELQFSKLPAQCFASDVEHTKLMTAVCEAILSTNQVDEPTKEIRVDEVKSSDLVQQKIEILQTIKEDSESLKSNQDSIAVENIKLEPDQSETKPVGFNQQKMIFEIQQNFKDKIDKLENKIDKLMLDEKPADEGDKIRAKSKVGERSRSRSTSPKSQQKKIMEHRPLITKTGLFGVIPTRSQIFGNDTSKGVQQISPNSHQKGDTKIQGDETITKYEDLVMTNQKRVDELLVQLETLHSYNTFFDKTGITEGDGNPIFCFEAKEELTYKPNLGTGENILQETYQVSSKNLFGQLEDLLTGNAQGEGVCVVDENQNDKNLGPSTSSARGTGIVGDTDCLQHQQPISLDFSSIIFKTFTAAEDEKDRGLEESQTEDFPIAVTSDHNFIVRNLPSITTNISDSFTVEKLLRNEDTLIIVDSSKTNSLDEFLLKESSSSVDTDINLKNKV